MNQFCPFVIRRRSAVVTLECQWIFNLFVATFCGCSWGVVFIHLSPLIDTHTEGRIPLNEGIGKSQMSLALDSSWNVMAHGEAREGKWRGNWRMQWVASTLHTTSEHGVSSITIADAAHLGCQQSTELTPPPHGADLNGLVLFAERRNAAAVESSWNVMAHGDAR